MNPAIFNEVEAQLINALISHDLHGVSTADMHHSVYNQDNTYVYNLDAAQDLEQIGTFNAIQTVMAYEQLHFSQTSPAIQYGNPCWVANMVVYILGEALIAHMFGDDEDYQNDSDITPEIAQRYSIMLDEALSAEPDLVSHLWSHL